MILLVKLDLIKPLIFFVNEMATFGFSLFSVIVKINITVHRAGIACTIFWRLCL